MQAEQAKLDQKDELLFKFMLGSLVKSLRVAGIMATVSAMFSCNNELDINADWRETIVVYGMLNSSDTVQYIRVAKAFLNENTSALKVAAISDSLYLDSAVVSIRSKDGSFRDTLRRVWNISKDSGLFANDKNPLYRFSTPPGRALDPNKVYVLEVYSPKTRNTVWAETNVVGRATILSPFRDSNSNFSVTPEFLTISMKAGQNSNAYDVKMHVTYQEFPKSDTNNKVIKTADWSVLTNATVPSSSNLLYKIPRQALIQFLGASISKDSGYYHRLLHIGMSVYGGNQTLTDYISVNEPSIGIVQKQAEYSNINGGTGLFASRCIQRINRVRFDGGSIIFLRNNAETKPLNLLP